MSVPHEHDWMSVNEVAERVGHTRQWVHHRIADGSLTVEHKGRRVDVDGQSVHVWMVIEMQKLLKRLEHLKLNLPYQPNDSS